MRGLGSESDETTGAQSHAPCRTHAENVQNISYTKMKHVDRST